MGYELKQVRNTLVVKLTGELDMLIVDRLRKEIDKRLEEQTFKNLIFNLERVSFIDSSGLGLIIGRYKKMNANSGRVYIVGASNNVEKILLFSGINKLVPIYNQEQDIISI